MTEKSAFSPPKRGEMANVEGVDGERRLPRSLRQ